MCSSDLSPVADMNNVADGPFGGSIIAALFLRRFVRKARRYAHFDIYGWRPGPKPLGPKGAEVQGARALLEVIAPLAAHLHLVAPDNERACRPTELAALLPGEARAKASCATVPELFPAPGVCRAAGEPIVVLGSLYLVGEVLARFHGGALPDGQIGRAHV